MPSRIPPALEAAAASLRTRYAGRHEPEVVEGTLLEEYQLLASRAKVQDFVPIFAERTARRRLETGNVAVKEAPAQVQVQAQTQTAVAGAPRRRAAAPRRRAGAAGPE